MSKTIKNLIRTPDMPAFTKNNGEIVDAEYARKRIWTKLRSDWGPNAYGYSIDGLQAVMARTFDDPEWLKGMNGMTVSGVYESVKRNMLYKGVSPAHHKDKGPSM